MARVGGDVAETVGGRGGDMEKIEMDSLIALLELADDEAENAILRDSGLLTALVKMALRTYRRLAG